MARKGSQKNKIKKQTKSAVKQSTSTPAPSVAKSIPQPQPLAQRPSSSNHPTSPPTSPLDGQTPHLSKSQRKKQRRAQIRSQAKEADESDLKFMDECKWPSEHLTPKDNSDSNNISFPKVKLEPREPLPFPIVATSVSQNLGTAKNNDQNHLVAHQLRYPGIEKHVSGPTRTAPLSKNFQLGGLFAKPSVSPSLSGVNASMDSPYIPKLRNNKLDGVGGTQTMNMDVSPTSMFGLLASPLPPTSPRTPSFNHMSKEDIESLPPPATGDGAEPSSPNAKDHHPKEGPALDCKKEDRETLPLPSMTGDGVEPSSISGKDLHHEETPVLECKTHETLSQVLPTSSSLSGVPHSVVDDGSPIASLASSLETSRTLTSPVSALPVLSEGGALRAVDSESTKKGNGRKTEKVSTENISPESSSSSSSPSPSPVVPAAANINVHEADIEGQHGFESTTHKSIETVDVSTPPSTTLVDISSPSSVDIAPSSVEHKQPNADIPIHPSLPIQPTNTAQNSGVSVLIADNKMVSSESTTTKVEVDENIQDKNVVETEVVQATHAPQVDLDNESQEVEKEIVDVECDRNTVIKVGDGGQGMEVVNHNEMRENVVDCKEEEQRKKHDKGQTKERKKAFRRNGKGINEVKSVSIVKRKTENKNGQRDEEMERSHVKKQKVISEDHRGASPGGSVVHTNDASESPTTTTTPTTVAPSTEALNPSPISRPSSPGTLSVPTPLPTLVEIPGATTTLTSVPNVPQELNTSPTPSRPSSPGPLNVPAPLPTLFEDLITNMANLTIADNEISCITPPAPPAVPRFPLELSNRVSPLSPCEISQLLPTHDSKIDSLSIPESNRVGSCVGPFRNFRTNGLSGCKDIELDDTMVEAVDSGIYEKVDLEPSLSPRHETVDPHIEEPQDPPRWNPPSKMAPFPSFCTADISKAVTNYQLVSKPKALVFAPIVSVFQRTTPKVLDIAALIMRDVAQGKDKTLERLSSADLDGKILPAEPSLATQLESKDTLLENPSPAAPNECAITENITRAEPCPVIQLEGKDTSSENPSPADYNECVVDEDASNEGPKCKEEVIPFLANIVAQAKQSKERRTQRREPREKKPSKTSRKKRHREISTDRRMPGEWQSSWSHGSNVSQSPTHLIDPDIRTCPICKEVGTRIWGCETFLNFQKQFPAGQVKLGLSSVPCYVCGGSGECDYTPEQAQEILRYSFKLGPRPIWLDAPVLAPLPPSLPPQTGPPLPSPFPRHLCPEYKSLLAKRDARRTYIPLDIVINTTFEMVTRAVGSAIGSAFSFLRKLRVKKRRQEYDDEPLAEGFYGSSSRL